MQLEKGKLVFEEPELAKITKKYYTNIIYYDITKIASITKIQIDYRYSHEYYIITNIWFLEQK